MELDNNLNKKTQEKIPVVPERDLGDRSVPYSKLEMTGRIKREDFHSSSADAGTTSKGISSFNSNHFSVSSGSVSLGVIDGWIPVVGTFSFYSSTKINVSSGAASIYNVGDKLRFQNNDSGAYLYVSIVTVADTLLTVFGNTVPNATLTDAEYSKVEPLDFPSWNNWSAGLSGFSVAPSNDVYRYKLIGRMCTLKMRQATAGTSNSTGFTISLPFAAATITNMFWGSPAMVMDNGVNLTTPGLMLIASAGTVLTVYTNYAQAVFTASGSKRLTIGEITYEIAV